MEGSDIRIARAELHFWEEAMYQRKKRFGDSIFFRMSVEMLLLSELWRFRAKNKGFVVTAKQLADTFIMLQEKGAHNINLVNPTHFAVQIKEAVDIARDKLTIPIVYNCGGCEKQK